MDNDQILDCFTIRLIPNEGKYYSPDWHSDKKQILKQIIVRRSSRMARPNFLNVLHARYVLMHPNNCVQMSCCPFVNQQGEIDEDLMLRRKIASAQAQVTKTQNRINEIVAFFHKTLYPDAYKTNETYLKELNKLETKKQKLTELLN